MQQIVISHALEHDLATAISECEHDRIFILADEKTAEACLPLISSFRTHLETDNEIAIDTIRMEILDVLRGNVNIPVQPGVPVFLPVLEAVYPIFMANDLMECCMEHIYEKCMNEYMYYVSEFTGIDYDDILFTVING